MKRLKSQLQLFLSMFKIGLFTFGGGYAMINLLENEFVSKKSWISHDEFMDLVTIAESTPGPIAINCATYLGYKREKLIGSIFATLGMIAPSLTIIYFISLFFNQFLAITWVASAFRGIQVAVILLIFSAVLKMLNKIKKTPLTVLLISITFAVMILFGLFAVNFSSIFYILISGSIGLLIYTIGYMKKADKKEVTK